MCALLHSGSRCAICSGPIDRTKPLFATSGVFFPKSDPLWRFCDAPMHWDCYARWGERRRFARACFNSWVEAEQTSVYWGKVYLDDLLFVTVNQDPAIGEAHLHLGHWGTRDVVKLKDWTSFLTNEAGFVTDLHPALKEMWELLFPVLRDRLPTVDVMIRQVDWGLKNRRAAELEKRDQVARDVARKKLDDYNALAAAVAERMQREGLLCPRCSRKGDDFRVMDGGKGRKSYLVCVGCGGSVWPDDLPGV